MASLQLRIVDRLRNDAALMAMLPGQVWDRRLERDGRTATAAAFGSTPPHRIKACAVVPDWSEVLDPSGPGAAFMGFPTVWLYAFDDGNGNGRAAVAAIWERCFGLLNGWATGTDNGTNVMIEVVGRLGARDDETIGDAVVDTMRLQADGLWRRV